MSLEKEHKVYVRVNEDGVIIDVGSDSFIYGLDIWKEIDSGYGDKYHHAQENYFDKPIMDDRGIYRYKLEDGTPVERTQEEMDADWVEPVQPITIETRVRTVENKTAELEESLDMLLSGVTSDE